MKPLLLGPTLSNLQFVSQNGYLGLMEFMYFTFLHCQANIFKRTIHSRKKKQIYNTHILCIRIYVSMYVRMYYIGSNVIAVLAVKSNGKKYNYFCISLIRILYVHTNTHIEIDLGNYIQDQNSLNSSSIIFPCIMLPNQPAFFSYSFIQLFKRHFKSTYWVQLCLTQCQTLTQGPYPYGTHILLGEADTSKPKQDTCRLK